MSTYVLACPLCSVCPPAGERAGPGYTRTPRVSRGRRSGKFWFWRNVGCAHGPAISLEAHATAETISGPWNEWATKAAHEKADALKLDALRREDWLRQVGA